MLKKAILGAVFAAVLSGCMSYAGVTAVGPDKVLVTRNDGLLFGFLRKIYICKVTDAGLTDCVETKETEDM